MHGRAETTSNPQCNTDELEEGQCFHPKVQKTREALWKTNTSTTSDIIERVKKVSGQKRRKHKRGPLVRTKIKERQNVTHAVVAPPSPLE